MGDHRWVQGDPSTKPVSAEPETTATPSPRPATPTSEPALSKPLPSPGAPRPTPSYEPSRPFGMLNAEAAKVVAAVTSVDTRLPPMQAPQPQPQRVLLVDDSRSIRTLLKIYLMARAFEYIEAESAEAGLVDLDAQPVDLILTDFHMDGMNGADFAAAVRAHRDPLIAKTPILMMTGDANAAEVRNRGQKAGINAFVRKPVSCAQLMTLVDTILPPKKA